MKKNNFLIFALFLIASVFANAQEKKKMRLVWKDEFNYRGLPKKSKWSYEVGHLRNNEQQYYTRSRKENAWVENGTLRITAKKETFPNEYYKKGETDWRFKDSLENYTSASINTLGKAGWKYGRIEVKAKLPKGAGIWPAIWMMGTNRQEVGWPKCGEIDIMEFIGNHPEDIYGTIHYPEAATGHKSNGSTIKRKVSDNDFHVYAIEWDEKKIDIFLDDKKYHSFEIDTAGTTVDNAFRKPFYLLINLAAGASWPGPIDDAILPQQFLIDYVRIYQ